jgi:hypothetical protein
VPGVRRAAAGIVLVIVLSGLAAPAAAAPAPEPSPAASAASAEPVTAPYVGFDPLFAPWWLEHAARTRAPGRTTTALYLADTGTPETGRAFALVRGIAVPGAERCGAVLPPLDVRTGPFRRAEAVQAGPIVILRRTNVRPGRPLVMLVARGLTTAEITQLAQQARVRKGVLAPRTIPNDLHLAGLAPVDATLTSGPGTSFRLVGGVDGARRVELHAAVLRGPAATAAAFFRAGSVGMSCTPGRYSLTTVGAATVAATGTVGDDAGRVAKMVKTVGPAGFATNVGWVDHPGVTQFARRCKGGFPDRETISGDTHGHLWSVGFPLGFDGPLCIGARAGGTLTPDDGAGSSSGMLRIAVRHVGPCGLSLVAGLAPAATRRVVVRSGRAPAQRARLRAPFPTVDPDARWAAFVRTAPTTVPMIRVTAYSESGRKLGTERLASVGSQRCRAGRPIPTTTASTTP